MLKAPLPAWVTRAEPMEVPGSVSGTIFMRRQDVIIHIDSQGERQFIGYRARLLNASALQTGNIALTWNPANGPATVHTIKVYRDGQTIDMLEQARFEVLRREDQLEAAMLDGLLTAVFHVPDLRVGDELEVDMTTTKYDMTLGNTVSGLLFLGPTPPPGRFHLEISWDKGRKPALKPSPDLIDLASEREDRIEMRFDNPAVKQPIKDAPGRFQWQRNLEYSGFPDWPTFSRRFAALFTKASGLSAASPIKQEAARIAAAHAAPLDRAAAALKLVQQDVRYVFVGLNGGNYTPASAEETWQRRYGDCKGKTALLLSLLAELGITAEAVLANTSGADDGFDERLPGVLLFDHVFVRAHIGGAVYWLDGTLPAVAPPAAQPVLPLRWVLPLTAEGSALARLEWKPARQPDELTLYEIDARTGFDQPARITSTTIRRGVKGLQQQSQLSAVPANQLLSALRQELTGDTWQTIEDVQWRYDQSAAASILTIVGTGTVDWSDDGDGAKSLALPGGGFRPPEKRVRPPDQDQTTPFASKPDYDCFVTTVRVPPQTKAVQWTAKPGFDTHFFGRNYYRAFEFRDGAIRMVRGSRTEQVEIDAAAARRDNGRIAAFDNSMGWIFYNPLEKRGTMGGGERVPATYEIDWTGADVPCKASTALK